jgi:ferritin-like protein
MSSESLHAPRERLSQHTLLLHHAIVSLMEELDAIDWYRQRADDTEDEVLRQLLLHNMREEMEHASMLLEWIRRNNSDFAEHMQTYLFTKAPILEVEDEATGKGVAKQTGGKSGGPEPRETDRGFTIGSLKER